MELSDYIKGVLEITKKNGSNTVEFDIGAEPLYSKGKVVAIWVNERSANRIKFTVKRSK